MDFPPWFTGYFCILQLPQEHEDLCPPPKYRCRYGTELSILFLYHSPFTLPFIEPRFPLPHFEQRMRKIFFQPLLVFCEAFGKMYQKPRLLHSKPARSLGSVQYVRGLCSKIPSRYLKAQIVLNPLCVMFFLHTRTYDKVSFINASKRLTAIT